MTTTFILSSPANESIATRLMEVLRSGGFGAAFAADAGESDADTAIVVMSEASLADPRWRAAVNLLSATRVIPVALGPIDADEVPEKLRPINWIYWKDDATSIGQLLAARNYSPERYRIAVQITSEARAWSDSGRPRSALISDDKRVRELRAVLDEEPGGALLPPDDTTRSFVQESITAASRKRRRKRYRRWSLAGLVLVIALVAVRLIPELRFERKLGFSAFVTDVSADAARGNSSWFEMQAATVVVNGEGPVKSLAAGRLRELIVRDSSIGRVAAPGFSIEAAIPDQDGLALIAVLGDGSGKNHLTVLDIRDSTVIDRMPLSNHYGFIAIDPSLRFVAVAGSAGAEVIDLASGRTTLLTDDKTTHITFVNEAEVAVASGDTVAHFDVDGNRLSVISVQGDILALAESPSGASVLLHKEPNGYQIVDTATGEVRLSATLPSALISRGGLDPEGIAAYVTGPERQIWRLDSNDDASPTGIPAADSTTLVLPLSQGRLLVGSATDGLQVFDGESGVNLGRVCGNVHGVTKITVDATYEHIACLGLRQGAVWPLPTAPRDNPASHTTEAASRWEVEYDGGAIRIVSTDGEASAWYTPGIGEVSAAAIDVAGEQLIVGSADGRIALLDRASGNLAVAVRWRVPDRSKVVKVGWAPEPSALTASDLWWEVPDCRGCSTGLGLIAAYRDKRKPCWEPQQLVGVDHQTRVDLQLFLCGGES